MVKKNRKDFLSDDVNEPEIDLLRKHERTGRPLGKDSFIETMESLLNQRLKPQKPGPKRKNK
jgi:putative transposase